MDNIDAAIMESALRELYRVADALDTCLVNCEYLADCERCEPARVALQDVLTAVRFIYPDIDKPRD